MICSMFLKWTLALFTCLALAAASKFVSTGVGKTVDGRICDELRREMMTLFQYAQEKKAWPAVVMKHLPNWVDFSLLVNCAKRRNARTNFNPSSTNDNGGSLGTLGVSGNILATSDDGGQQGNTILRGRRNAQEDYVTSFADGEATLNRVKRFLASSPGAAPDFGSMSLGTLNPSPGREVSESAQMMNNLLMLSKLQKNSLAREYGAIGRGGSSYIGDRVSFGSGMYGDTYTGKRKREATASMANVEAGMEASASAQKPRKKRFIFAEPAEGPASQSLFSVLFGPARDPNTGKRTELGGDVMKRVIGNTFTAFLPPGLQPPPGKELGDFVKNVSPLWFFSSFGSSSSIKKQNRNGLYGEALPGRRRKRSSEDNSDAVTFGDVSVPVELFENQGSFRF